MWSVNSENTGSQVRLHWRAGVTRDCIVVRNLPKHSGARVTVESDTAATWCVDTYFLVRWQEGAAILRLGQELGVTKIYKCYLLWRHILALL